MAKIKGGPTPMTEAVLLAEVTDRVGNGFSQSDVRTIVRALKDQIALNLQDGYKVTLTGLVSFTPQAKEGRKKGTVVRNPFDGTERTLRADEPSKFKVKALASSSIVKNFPTVRTAKGQALLQQLAPKKQKGK